MRFTASSYIAIILFVLKEFTSIRELGLAKPTGHCFLVSIVVQCFLGPVVDEKKKNVVL